MHAYGRLGTSATAFNYSSGGNVRFQAENEFILFLCIIGATSEAVIRSTVVLV